jgi:hypothetical protein
MTFRNPLTSLKSINSLNVAIGLCLCALATASTASEQQPHQHGHAQLQIAVENNNIDLILTSPAYNLLGFEHQPRTEQQKQTLENARQWLTTQALITPASGNCTVESASMDFNAKAAEKEHHNHDHHHDEAMNEHANIEVSQVLNCKSADIGGQLTTPLIAQFPEIQELDVEWVTNSRQGSTKLSSPENQFQL